MLLLNFPPLCFQFCAQCGCRVVKIPQWRILLNGEFSSIANSPVNHSVWWSGRVPFHALLEQDGDSKEMRGYRQEGKFPAGIACNSFVFIKNCLNHRAPPAGGGEKKLFISTSWFRPRQAYLSGQRDVWGVLDFPAPQKQRPHEKKRHGNASLNGKQTKSQWQSQWNVHLEARRSQAFQH